MLGAAATAFVMASAPTPTPISLQRYVMGTMIDIVVYHPSRADGARAAERAMGEIERLDRVLSHFKADSDLSRLNRDGGRGFVTVDPSLYDIVEQSIAWSRRTGGTFDITIAPLLRTWKQAYADGRRPSDEEIAAAKRCVGSDRIALEAPDKIHFRSACLAIDLGGIGKGYAVDRALELLKAEGVTSAMINAGGSSIGTIGTPPGQSGWAVRIAAKVPGNNGPSRDTLLLRDMSMSTSQQNPLPFATTAGSFGEILDPRTGAPAEGRTAIAVITPSGTTAEALTKALLMMPADEAKALLASLPDVSALWMSPNGELLAAHGESRLKLSAPVSGSSLAPLRGERDATPTRLPRASGAPPGVRGF
jgi:thiamine biosynthesis lipoprotein